MWRWQIVFFTWLWQRFWSRLEIGELEMRQALSLPFTHERFSTLLVFRPTSKREQWYYLRSWPHALPSTILFMVYLMNLTFSSLVLYFSIQLFSHRATIPLSNEIVIQRGWFFWYGLLLSLTIIYWILIVLLVNRRWYHCAYWHPMLSTRTIRTMAIQIRRCSAYNILV